MLHHQKTNLKREFFASDTTFFFIGAYTHYLGNSNSLWNTKYYTISHNHPKCQKNFFSRYWITYTTYAYF